MIVAVVHPTGLQPGARRRLREMDVAELDEDISWLPSASDEVVAAAS